MPRARSQYNPSPPVSRKRGPHDITRRAPHLSAEIPSYSYRPPKAESPEYSPTMPGLQLNSPDSDMMSDISTPSSLSSVNPMAYSGIDTSKIGTKPPPRKYLPPLADLLGDPRAEKYRKYPAGISTAGPSRPAPGDDGYEKVYVFKEHMPITFAGKPIVFPSTVFIGREHPDGIHLFETTDMSLLVFVPNDWDAVDGEKE
jgi:hypothetical protein